MARTSPSITIKRRLQRLADGRSGARAWIAALLGVLWLAGPASAANRVVSLNLCTDQLLVLLAPAKVAGLTLLARDPSLSFVAPAAAHLPIVRPSAEAVLRLHPDLILAASYGAQATVALLAALRIPVLRVALAQDFPGIRAETRTVAQALGAPDRGEALIAAMDARLAVAVRGPPRTAIAWEPRGYTDGSGTLMDAVLHAAGLVNGATGRRLGVEALVRHPPDLLVVPQAPRFPSLATDAFNDPALGRIPRLGIPPALTICAGPFTARAVSLLERDHVTR